MKKYIKFATACLMGLALASCAEKEYEYTPGKADNVNIQMDPSQARSIDADGNDIAVVLSRTDASGSASVKVALTDPSGIFTLSSSTAEFASGSNTATVNLSYDYDKLVKDEKYNVEIAIADESLTSNYGFNVLPLAISKAWKKIGTVQFYDAWFFGYVWEKQLIQSPDGSQTYRLLQPFTKADIEAEGFEFTSELPYIEFTIDEEGGVHYGDYFYLGFNYSGMTCAYADPLYLQKDEANEAENIYYEDLGLIQFCWYPVLKFKPGQGYSWWGSTANAFIGMPGCDLAEILGL